MELFEVHRKNFGTKLQMANKAVDRMSKSNKIDVTPEYHIND
jgi:hypothetical protein